MMKCRGMGAVNSSKYKKGGKIGKYAGGGEVDENGVPRMVRPTYDDEEPAPKPKVQAPKPKDPSMLERLGNMLRPASAIKKRQAALDAVGKAKGGRVK